jgi:hypothetical protein
VIYRGPMTPAKKPEIDTTKRPNLRPLSASDLRLAVGGIQDEKMPPTPPPI